MGRLLMSKLRRKHELEQKVDEFITGINREISALDGEFKFISEEDGEIKSRVQYFTTDYGADVIRLKFLDTFSLEDAELDRFIAYMDNIREEIKILRSK